MAVYMFCAAVAYSRAVVDQCSGDLLVLDLLSDLNPHESLAPNKDEQLIVLLRLISFLGIGNVISEYGVILCIVCN